MQSTKIVNREEFTKCHHMPKQESHHHQKAPPAEKDAITIYQKENGNS
jgi:hypothetical protein